jgi:serine/threonine protein kinase
MKARFSGRDAMSMIGRTLVHYKIISQLGKGGMGEVFRARDQKLDRDVAIKVLPEEFAREVDGVCFRGIRQERNICSTVSRGK